MTCPNCKQWTDILFVCDLLKNGSHLHVIELCRECKEKHFRVHSVNKSTPRPAPPATPPVIDREEEIQERFSIGECLVMIAILVWTALLCAPRAARQWLTLPPRKQKRRIILQSPSSGAPPCRRFAPTSVVPFSRGANDTAATQARPVERAHSGQSFGFIGAVGSYLNHGAE